MENIVFAREGTECWRWSVRWIGLEQQETVVSELVLELEMPASFAVARSPV